MKKWRILHEAEDNARIEREMKEARAKQIKQNALNKLTVEERRALGL